MSDTNREQINRSVDGSLRNRIAAVCSGELCRQQHSIDPDRQWPWLDMGALADAVIRELGLQRRTGQGPYANQVWYETDRTFQ